LSEESQGPTSVDLQHRVRGQCENDSAHTTCDEEGWNLVDVLYRFRTTGADCQESHHASFKLDDASVQIGCQEWGP